MESTADCLFNKCTHCGVCNFKDVQNNICHPSGNVDPVNLSARDPLWSLPSNGLIGGGDDIQLNFTYSKIGPARWLSHLELMQVFRRALRRANVPTLYSNGFHPHMKLSLANALKVGAEGMSEKGAVELSEHISEDNLIEKLNKALPFGIKVDSLKITPQV